MLKITWLEELASESNTIQAQEDIMSVRVMASNIYKFEMLFDHISGLISSFGFSSFVNLDMVSLLPWIAAGSSRKSMRKIEMHQGFVSIMKYDSFHDQRPLDKVELMFQRPGVCADAQC